MFNQPLSFDTSSVTDMGYMFGVCAPPRALPLVCGRAPPARCVRRGRVRHPPPANPYTLLRILRALLSTRQQASAFNQPLSFDMSSAPDLSHMFRVRSFPLPAPNSAPCTLLAAASRLPARSSPRISHVLKLVRLSVGHKKRFVQRQQTVHPLHLGGHLRWLWPELGSGKLPVAAALTALAALTSVSVSASVVSSAIATTEPAVRPLAAPTVAVTVVGSAVGTAPPQRALHCWCRAVCAVLPTHVARPCQLPYLARPCQLGPADDFPSGAEGEDRRGRLRITARLTARQTVHISC